MKIKILLMAALVSAAALSASAGVRFGIAIGVPAPVIVATPVIVVAPVVLAPVVVAAAPACPGVGYVWAPEYWAGRVGLPGAWRSHPVHVFHGPFHDGYRH